MPADDEHETQLITGMAPGDPGWGMDPDLLILFDADCARRTHTSVSGDQRVHYAQVAAAIGGTVPNPVTSLQAIAVMAVIEAAVTSAREARSIRFACPRPNAQIGKRA